MVAIAAWLFALLAAAIVLFQLSLAAGAPWGEYAMGGAVRGRFPPLLRAAAVVQAAVIAAMACVVLSRAGVALGRWARMSRRLVWAVVGFSALSLVLNLMTPSARERVVWAPVAFALLLTSAAVATRSR